MRAWMLALAVIAAVAAVPGAPPGRAAASAPPESLDLLRRELVDVALLPPGRPGAGPRLLAVGADPAGSAGVLLAVLDRGAGRWNARTEVREDPSPDGAEAPWLVALDDRRFALLTVEPDARRTTVRHVTWNGEEIRLGNRLSIGRRIDDAGAADVDGDGVRELVLAEAITRRGGPTCQGSTLVVVDPRTMSVRAEHDIPNLRLASGAIGPLDASPGDELVATVFRNCPAGPASAYRLAIAAIRLSDGHVLLDERIAAADTTTAWSGRPAIADLESDGRPEVLLGSPAGALVLSPEAGWRRAVLPDLPGVLLGVRPTVGSRRSGGVVVVMHPTAVVAAVVRRGANGWLVEPAGRVDVAAVGADAWSAATTDGRNAALRLRGGPAWLDGSVPCSPFVVALAVLPCWPARNPPSLAESALLPGPAWFATRPVTRVAGPGSPILVARTDAWPGRPGRLTAPAPLAAEPADSGWRHGPSTPFTLAEVAPDALRGRPAPPGAIDPTVPEEHPEVTVRGGAGSRLLLAVRSAAPTAAALLAGLPGLLASSDPRLRLALHRLDGPASDPGAPALAAAGPPRAELRIPLVAPGTAADGAGWDATVVTIGPLGDVSAPVRARLAIDETAPTLQFDAPFLSAPWPLTAGLPGATEPGTSVRVDGAPVPVAADGSFRLPARLAPWPQRVELVARDAAGNETVVRVDVVGGLDYRRLPWAPILLVTLLAGAALGGRGLGGRTTGGQRDSRPGSDVPNEIEELATRPTDVVR